MQSVIFLAILAYFFFIFFVSRLAGGSDLATSSFFNGGKKSRWYLVATGMVSASVSGISIVSVTGMVGDCGFTYMQMVFGFFFGYVAIVYVLLPLYYRLNLTSIYGYLSLRFGPHSHKTGALFFILFKFVTATSKLYIVLVVLQFYIFDSWGVPFFLSAMLFICFIFAYTFRSGLKALVWTDCFQTVSMLLAVTLLIYSVMVHLDFNFAQMLTAVCENPNSKIFVFDDFYSRQNFFKQFLSGIFVVIVMTGLDQDVMQKNLSCPNLHDARKNMMCYGASFIPVNLMFLVLGCLLLILAQKEGISLPDKADHILPFFAMHYFGQGVAILFVVALLAAAFSSADSALVSLTTSVSVDILNIKTENLTIRKRVFIHSIICIVFCLLMLLFRLVNNQNALDSIYTIVSYLYGPLLGLYAFGLFTKYVANDSLVPYVCVFSPIICFALSVLANNIFKYHFGYEMLLFNGMLTFWGLYLTRIKGQCKIPV